MDNNFKALLNALAMAILALLIVNLISFCVDVAQHGIGENWSFRFKHGVLYLDERPSGLVLGSLKATGLMFVVFIVSLFRSYKSGRKKKSVKPANHPRLHYSSQGRGGYLRFENNLTSFDMWWEFGGGNALALIDIPSEKEWEATTKIPLAQREETLRFIAERVIQDQASGRGTYTWDDNTLTIYQP